MASKKPSPEFRALVTVFDRLDAAKTVANYLHNNGFGQDQIELVNRDIRRESLEIRMPKIHETTGSSAEVGALKGAGIGLGLAAGFGAAAVALTASPAIAIGAMIYAGLAGAMIGGVGGVDRADLDDSINLPTIEEYQKMVNDGNSLVVVCGTHDEVMRAESIMKNMASAGSHVHRVHGHLYHEHPAKLPNSESPSTDDMSKPR